LSLQKQAQYFIDIAEKAMDLEHNRTFLQQLSDHVALKEKVNGKWKTLLRTS